MAIFNLGTTFRGLSGAGWGPFQRAWVPSDDSGSPHLVSTITGGDRAAGNAFVSVLQDLHSEGVSSMGALRVFIGAIDQGDAPIVELTDTDHSIQGWHGLRFAVEGRLGSVSATNNSGSATLTFDVPTDNAVGDNAGSIGTIEIGMSIAANAYGANGEFALNATNAQTLGLNFDEPSWGKLHGGLAEMFVESQLHVNGLEGAERQAAMGRFESVVPASLVLAGYVAIDAVASDGDGAGLLAELEALGMIRGASFGAMAGGFIPLDALDDIAALDSLNFARPVLYETHAGSVQSQNVASTNVDYLHNNYGLTGSGITIGFMSDSFNTATLTTQNTALTIKYANDIASGDLPAGVNILEDGTGTSVRDEGRAMAQLAYDIAPGIGILFHTALPSMANFAQGIIDLYNAGADIIVDDVRYFQEPMFQDGIIAQAVDTVTAGGAMYFSSAGNQGTLSYESVYRPSDQTINITGSPSVAGTYRFHDFDPGSGQDFVQSFTKTGSAAATYVLNWAEASAQAGGLGATSDLAIIIFNAAGTPIAAFSSNNVGADAIEFAQNASTTWAGFAIGVREGAGFTAPTYVKTAITGSVTLNEWRTDSGTSFGHSNARGAISVGASDWVDNDRFAAPYVAGEGMPYLETFSSRGDVPIFFDTAGNRLAGPQWRTNVDFTVSDGGNNTFFGSDNPNSGAYAGFEADTSPNFYGTSAAAPNAAAIAALMMQAFPTATRDQIEWAMKQSAIDIQVTYTGTQIGDGFDNRSGHGLVQADRAYQILAELLSATKTVTAGELALVSYDATATGSTTAIRFVLMADVPANTTVYLTDRAWDGTKFANPSTGEGTYAWTSSGAVTAGTVITLTAAQLSAAGITLDAAGETLYFYQGGQNRPIRFIFAADVADGNTTFNGNLTNTGLTDGTNAVATADDVGVWQGFWTGVSGSTLGSIASRFNWQNNAALNPNTSLSSPASVSVTSNSASYTESNNAPNSPAGAVVAPFSGATITDPTGTLQAAQVAITSGFMAGDVLSFTPAGAVNGLYDAATGVLFLYGAGSVTDYQTVLNSVRFAAAGDNPTNGGASATRTLSVNVGTATAYSAITTVTIDLNGINDAPVNTISTTPLAATEDTDIVVTGLSVSDPDANPATQDITVTLSVAHGTILIFHNVGNGVEIGDVTGNGTSTVTITATQNQINATFAHASGVTYRPDANWNGADTLTMTTNDNGFGGNDPGLSGTGTSEEDSDTRAITVTAANDAPTVIGGTTQTTVTIFEDSPSGSGELVSDLIESHFSDTADAKYNLGANPTGSVANTFAGIAVVGSAATVSTGFWEYHNGTSWVQITAATTSSAILLNAATPIRFNPAANFNGTAPNLTVRLVDTSGAAFSNGDTVNIASISPHATNNSGYTSRYSSTSIVLNGSITATNDAPSSTNLSGDSATWTEGSGPIALDVGGNATLADVDSTNFDGGSLTVSIGSGGVPAQDQLGINTSGTVTVATNVVSVGGTPIGTFTGGGAGGNPLVFTFNADASPAAVQALVRAITYTNSGGDYPFLGPRTISWTLVDNDGTANGGTDTLQFTSTVTVVTVNDAPSGTDYTATIDEDATYYFNGSDFGYSDVDGDAFGFVRIISLPTNGKLFYDLDGAGGDDPVEITGTGQAFAVNETINTGGLFYVPNANGNGNGFDSFTFAVIDMGGTQNGGANEDPTPNSFTFNVTPQPDAPVVDLNGAGAGINDSNLYFEGGAESGIGVDIVVSDAESDPIVSATVTISNASAGDALSVNLPLPPGISVDAVNSTATTLILIGSASASAYEDALGQVGYSNSSDNPTAGTRSITVTVNDGTADSAAATMSMLVFAVNDAPSGTDKTLDVVEDISLTLTTSDFGFSDVDGNSFGGIFVSTLPGLGTLYVDGNAITVAGTFVSATDIADGLLTYTPGANGNGVGYASFGFQVADNGPTGGSHQTVDQSANTITFDVSAENDAPTIANLDGDISSETEGVGGDVYSDVGRNAIVTDVDSANFDGGTLTVAISSYNGTDRIGLRFDAVVNIDPVPAIDGSRGVTVNGILIGSVAGGEYATPDNGTMTVTFNTNATPALVQQVVRNVQVRDQRSSPEAGTRAISFTLTDGDGGSSSYSTSHVVTTVNDAPAGTNKTVSTSEDDLYTFTLADFGFTDTHDNPANALAAVVFDTFPGNGHLMFDPDGSGPDVSVDISNYGAGYAIDASDIAAGRLYFVPDADEYGDNYASFTFRVRDDGGTANGGVDTDQSANTITINVTPDNIAPQATNLDAAESYTEDTGMQLTAIVVTDPDAGATITATLTLSNTAAGTLTTGTSGAVTATFVNGVWSATGALDDVNALLASVSFNPAANFNGSFSIDTSISDGIAPAVTGTKQFTGTAINDAPSGTDTTRAFVRNGNYVITQADFGFTDATDGGANALAAVTIVTLPVGAMGRLFYTPASGPVQSVSAGQTFSAADIAAGRLSFKPGAAANGPVNASFTFKVQDDGGTANGGVNTDATANTLTLTTINRAPTGTDQMVGIARTENHVVTAADLGFTDPDGNALASVTISTLPTAGRLFYDGVKILSAGLVVSGADLAAGKLTYQAVPGANSASTGSFTFVVRDNGGTTNGGADTDASANTLTYTVVNRAPAGSDGTFGVTRSVSHAVTLAELGYSDADGNAFASVTITALPASTEGRLFYNGVKVLTPGLTVSAADLAAGKLTWLSAAANGATSGSFSFTVSDDGGTANGGVNTDQSANMITYGVVNRAPAGTDKAVNIALSTTKTFTVADFGYSDADGDALASVTIATLPSVGRLFFNGVKVLTPNLVVTAADIAAGKLTYQAGTVSSDPTQSSFTFQVKDTGGAGYGGVDTDQTPNRFTFDNRPPALSTLAEDSAARVLFVESKEAVSTHDVGQEPALALQPGFTVSRGDLLHSLESHRGGVNFVELVAALTGEDIGGDLGVMVDSMVADTSHQPNDIAAVRDADLAPELQHASAQSHQIGLGWFLDPHF